MVAADETTGYRDADTLRELYHGDGLSQAEIAERFNCDRKTIGNWMARFDLDTNPGERISRKQMGENNSAYNQVELTCENCGDTFKRAKSSSERTKRDFCNQDCYRAWRREHQSELPDPPKNTVSEEDLLAELKRLRDQLERPPATSDIVRHGRFSWPTYVRKFGSIPEAREAAGLEKYIPFGKRGLRAKHGQRHPYGENWRQNREKRIQHDDEQCVVCGMDRNDHRERFGVDIHVHHIVSAVEFDDLEVADKIDNLVTLCATHHREWERMPVIPDRRQL